MNMMNVCHYLLTQEGAIREVTPDEAAAVASGESALPEYADLRLRYLQVVVDDKSDGENIRVRTAGATVEFDHDGILSEAGIAMGAENAISRFEHDTCVQLALGGVLGEPITRH